MAKGASSASTVAAAALGDPEAAALLEALVRAAPTNLEDPVHDRYEKPNYSRTAATIAGAARAWGLDAKVVDARELGVDPSTLKGGPRPNVVVELNVGAPGTVLVLAHFDVVPVPAEQLSRWRSPPHELTARADGRLYGRGSNDDLGSGVVGSLLALHRLKTEGGARHNVRLLACCDEETGGEGGVEAFKHALPAVGGSARANYLAVDVALIPDGSPHTTAGSSGVLFLDADVPRAALTDLIEFGTALVLLHDMASRWVSVYPSEDWPDHGAPAPTITGRASLTKLDWSSAGGEGERPRLVAARAETDAANQIAEAVTLVVSGRPESLDVLFGELTRALPAPFRLAASAHTPLVTPAGARAWQVLGQSTHGGYPHRGHNPVPPTLDLLRTALTHGWLDPGQVLQGTFTVDLRLPPEMPIADALAATLDTGRAWIRARGLEATLEAPPARCRAGYAVPVDHPQVTKFQKILQETMGSPGIFGEYGGTDASALADLRLPSGAPLPAIVFGSMDREAHIHEAEESVDPKLIRQVAETIVRFVREP